MSYKRVSMKEAIENATVLMNSLNNNIEYKMNNKYTPELQFVKDKLENEHSYKVGYIALQGSQNYGLDINTDDYKSDIDMKAIIIPDLDMLLDTNKPLSTTIDI